METPIQTYNSHFIPRVDLLGLFKSLNVEKLYKLFKDGHASLPRYFKIFAEEWMDKMNDMLVSKDMLAQFRPSLRTKERFAIQ